MEHAVIKARYTDYRRVPSLGVMRIICEIPIESSPELHANLGDPGHGIPVAIAILNEGAGQETTGKKPEGGEGATTQSPSQHCATWCKNKEFQKWLGLDSEQAARKYVLAHLQILSRSALDEDPEAYERWRNLYTEFVQRHALKKMPS